MTQLNRFLREAVVTIVHQIGDDQLERIASELDCLGNPRLLVRRLTHHTVLIQGIPVTAGSPHDADAVTWEILYEHVRDALRATEDQSTRIASIDVRESDSLLI